MNLLDLLGSGHEVKIKTRLTPEISFPLGRSGPAGDGSGGLELGPLLRPKITVDGIEFAPYGEPEDWILYVELAALGLLAFYLAKKL